MEAPIKKNFHARKIRDITSMTKGSMSFDLNFEYIQSINCFVYIREKNVYLCCAKTLRTIKTLSVPDFKLCRYSAEFNLLYGFYNRRGENMFFELCCKKFKSNQEFSGEFFRAMPNLIQLVKHQDQIHILLAAQERVCFFNRNSLQTVFNTSIDQWLTALSYYEKGELIIGASYSDIYLIETKTGNTIKRMKMLLDYRSSIMLFEPHRERILQINVRMVASYSLVKENFLTTKLTKFADCILTTNSDFARDKYCLRAKETYGEGITAFISTDQQLIKMTEDFRIEVTRIVDRSRIEFYFTGKRNILLGIQDDCNRAQGKRRKFLFHL